MKKVIPVLMCVAVCAAMSGCSSETQSKTQNSIPEPAEAVTGEASADITETSADETDIENTDSAVSEAETTSAASDEQTTSGGSGMGKTNSELEPSCKGAVLKDGKRFAANAGEDELRKWAEPFIK